MSFGAFIGRRSIEDTVRFFHDYSAVYPSSLPSCSRRTMYRDGQTLDSICRALDRSLFSGPFSLGFDIVSTPRSPQQSSSHYLVIISYHRNAERFVAAPRMIVERGVSIEACLATELNRMDQFPFAMVCDRAKPNVAEKIGALRVLHEETGTFFAHVHCVLHGYGCCLRNTMQTISLGPPKIFFNDTLIALGKVLDRFRLDGMYCYPARPVATRFRDMGRFCVELNDRNIFEVSFPPGENPITDRSLFQALLDEGGKNGIPWHDIDFERLHFYVLLVSCFHQRFLDDRFAFSDSSSVNMLSIHSQFTRDRSDLGALFEELEADVRNSLKFSPAFTVKQAITDFVAEFEREHERIFRMYYAFPLVLAGLVGEDVRCCQTVSRQAPDELEFLRDFVDEVESVEVGHSEKNFLKAVRWWASLKRTPEMADLFSIMKRVAGHGKLCPADRDKIEEVFAHLPFSIGSVERANFALKHPLSPVQRALHLDQSMKRRFALTGYSKLFLEYRE